MRTFKNSEQKTFEQLLVLSQRSLKKVLSTFLKRHYPKVIETKDYIYAEGTIPVALVAHMDTVFKNPPEEIFFDPKHNVMWSPQGLGADDRAGVFGIVQIIRSGLLPHVIFTTDEERGALGAMQLAKLDCPFSDVKYLIQLDRRGSDDCVFYECDNKEFVDYVEDFGFSLNYGSFSDISELCPAWGVAGVNLSIGYRDEHSETEVLFVGQMLATIAKVKKMLNAAETAKRFEYIPSPVTNFPFSQNWYNWGTITYGLSDEPNVMKCNGCKKYFMEEELFPTVMLDKTTKFYCPDCMVDKIAWCDECGSAYEKYSPEAPDTGICPICSEISGGKLSGNRSKAKG